LLGSQCSLFVPVVLLGVLPHRGSESGLALMCTLSVVGQDGCLWLVSLLCLSAFELGSRAAFAPADVFWVGRLGAILCVVGWVVCVWGFLFCSAVVQLGGFVAGTVLSLIPLWGGRRRSHAVSSRLSVSPVVGE
jgi:hypothetical protein